MNYYRTAQIDKNTERMTNPFNETELNSAIKGIQAIAIYCNRISNNCDKCEIRNAIMCKGSLSTCSSPFFWVDYPSKRGF